MTNNEILAMKLIKTARELLASDAELNEVKLDEKEIKKSKDFGSALEILSKINKRNIDKNKRMFSNPPNKGVLESRAKNFESVSKKIEKVVGKQKLKNINSLIARAKKGAFDFEKDPELARKAFKDFNNLPKSIWG